MNWKSSLNKILSGYFSYQTLVEGVSEMVFVTECSLEFHNLYLSAIEEGIMAASKGDDEVTRIIIDSNAFFVANTHEALEFLQRIKQEYLTQYSDATGNTGETT